MMNEQVPPQEEQQAPAGNSQAAEQIEGEFVEEGQVQLSEAQQMQIDAYSDNATMMVYSEKSQDAILHLLQQGENKIEGVATTAFTLHKQLEQSLEQEGEQLNEITMAVGAAHLVSELVVLADAAGLYQLTEEERMEAFRQAVMQYFHAGLVDGSIDPIELQKTIEPLFTEEQASMAMEVANQKGLAKTPPPAGMGSKPVQQQPPQQNQNSIMGRLQR